MAYGSSKPRMGYKGNSPSTRTMGVKPYGADGKPNYKKGPKGDIYGGFRYDKNRGMNEPTLQEKRKYGQVDNEKSYQMPSEKYTNGQMPDTKTPPPSKPPQRYGKKGGVSVTPSNKHAKPSAAGTAFAKTNAMPKPKKITSMAQLRGVAKKKMSGASGAGY